MNANAVLGQRLKQAREQAGLSQEELARRLGYKSKSSIAKIEKGVQTMTLSAIKSFAQELGLSPSALVERQELEYRGDNARPSSESPELQKLLALAKKAPTKDVNMAIAVLKALRSARKEDGGSTDNER
jgi:SOS-response transcriptional repressors (recA-mediated autopeptidases)